MNFLTSNITSIFKVLTLAVLFQVTLWGSTSVELDSKGTYHQETNYTEVSLDSFGNIGIGIVLVVTSLLGAFFLRDNLNTAI